MGSLTDILDRAKEAIGKPLFKVNGEKEQKLVDLVDRDYEKARTARQQYIDEMKELNRFYMGDHWHNLRSQKAKQVRPNSVDNFVFSMIEGMVSDFSTEPDILCRPTEPDDEDNAKAMTELTRFILNKNKFKDEQAKALRNFFKYGIFALQVYWDNTWQGGKGGSRWVGDIRIISRNPGELFPDPRCRDHIQNAEYMIVAIPRTIEYVRKNYPERGIYVTDDIEFQDVEFFDEQQLSADLSSKRVLVKEYWYKGKPKYLEDGEEENGYGVHVATVAGGVLLRHKSYVYDHGKYPFVWRVCYPRENTIWGFGEIYQLKIPQIMLNKTDENIIEGLVHQTFGIKVFNADSMSEKQKAVVRAKGTLPGQWFEVNDVDGIKPVFGQGIPSGAFEYYNQKKISMETITGRFDTTQGRIPKGITAASAIIELNERATSRMRSKELSVSMAIQEAGELISDLITERYTQERGYRVLGDDNRFHYKNFSNEQVKKVYIFKDNRTLPKQAFQPSEEMVQGEDYEEYSPEFDVQVKVGSEMPSGRTYYMELAKELYAAKAEDLETLWDVMETGKFPPKELIMERLQNKQPQPQPPGQPGQLPGMEEMLAGGNPEEGQPPIIPDVAIPEGQMPAQMGQMPQQMGQPGQIPPQLLELTGNG